MNANNVTKFPEHRMVRPTTVESFNEKLEEHKINYIDSIIMRHLTILIQSLHADGFDVEDEIFQKDYAFLANVLKATLMRSYGLHNPIQKLMDQIHSDDQEFETEETEATSPDELA